jgi:translocation and assembly module TamB
MARHYFRFYRFALFGLSALIVLFAAALTLMSSGRFHDYVLRYLEAKLNEVSGARIEVRNYQFRPLTLQVALEGMVLHGSEPRSGPPLFQARTIVFRINPVSVLTPTLHLTRLSIDGARIHLQTYPDGSLNLPGPEATSGRRTAASPNLVGLSVGRLVVNHADFEWNNQRLRFDVDAEDFGLNLSALAHRQYGGHLASSLVRLTIPERPIPAFSLSTALTLSRNKLALDGLDWQLLDSAHPAGETISGRGSATLYWAPTIGVRANLTTTGALLALARILDVHNVRAGTFSWTLEGSYGNGVSDAKGRFTSRGLSLASPDLRTSQIDVSCGYSLAHQRIEVSDLRLNFLGGSAEGGGEILLTGEKPRFAFSTRLHDIRLARLVGSVPALSKALSSFPVQGRADGQLESTFVGWFEHLTSHFDLTFRPTAEPGITAGHPFAGFAQGVADFTHGPLLTLERAEFHTPFSWLKGQGTLGGPVPSSQLLIAASTTNFDEWQRLAEVLLDEPGPVPLVLKSAASFNGTLSGPLDHLNLRGAIKVGSFTYRGSIWDSFEGNEAISPDRLHLFQAKLAAGDSTLRFDLAAGLTDWVFTSSSHLDITAQAQGSPLAGLEKALGVDYPVSGLVTGRIGLAGTRASLAGRGDAQISRGEFYQEPFDSASAHLVISQSVWQIDDLRLLKKSGLMVGHTFWDPGKQAFSVDLTGSNFALSDIHLITAHEAVTQAVLEGEASFKLEAHGTFSDPQAAASLSLDNITSEGKPLGTLEAKADWHSEEIHLQGDLATPGGRLHLGGVVGTRQNWPLNLDVQYSSFRADPWMEAFRGGLLQPLVTASGSLAVRGPLKELARITATGKTQTLTVILSNLAWKNDRPVEVRYADRLLEINPFRLEGPSTGLEIAGNINFRERAALDLNIAGHGDAKLLAALSPELESIGSFDLKLHAGGHPAQPLLNGSLTVNNLSLGLRSVAFRIGGLNGVVRLEGDRLTITSLKGMGAGGSISLEGSAVFSGAPRYDLTAHLDQARIEYPAQITSAVSGTLHLTGTDAGGQLNGHVTLRQMYVNEPFNLLGWIGNLNNLSVIPETGLNTPLASKLRLGVHVVSEPQVQLESRELTAVASVDLNFQGTLANPVGFGNIHLLGGQALLRGQRYKITRGDVLLTNPYRTTTTVDIEAQTRIQHYDLTLEVTGPADRPRISYRSDPPLPTTEILELLALGYSRQQQVLGSATSRSTFSSLGTSAILSQALSSQVSGRIERLFGVSRISIDPNVYGPGVGTGPRVTIEEQVTRDFTITYSVNTSGSQQQVIQLRWDLNERLSVFGERDINGVYGFELRLRQRFK